MRFGCNYFGLIISSFGLIISGFGLIISGFEFNYSESSTLKIQSSHNFKVPDFTIKHSPDPYRD